MGKEKIEENSKSLEKEVETDEKRASILGLTLDKYYEWLKEQEKKPKRKINESKQSRNHEENDHEK